MGIALIVVGVILLGLATWTWVTMDRHKGWGWAPFFGYSFSSGIVCILCGCGILFNWLA